jgi:hypothetical protein
MRRVCASTLDKYFFARSVLPPRETIAALLMDAKLYVANKKDSYWGLMLLFDKILFRYAKVIKKNNETMFFLEPIQLQHLSRAFKALKRTEKFRSNGQIR